MSIQTHSWTQ